MITINNMVGSTDSHIIYYRIEKRLDMTYINNWTLLTGVNGRRYCPRTGIAKLL